MRAALGRNVVANLLATASGIVVALIALPIVLDEVGTAAYGVWTIGLALILFFSVADTGFAPAIQRWTALAHGAGNLPAAARILWSALLLYVVLGLAAMAVLALLAEPLTNLFDFPADLREDAIEMFRLVGVVMLVTMLAAAVGNVLQGLERFVAFGFTTAIAALANLAAIIVLLADGRGIVGLAEAAIVQQLVMLVGRVWVLRDVLLAARPGLVPRAEMGEMAVFSAKLQPSVFAWLLNSQSDKIVMGLVASAATVGQLGVASQIADAGRLIAGAALAPIVTSLAVVRAGAEHQALQRHFAWTHRLWLEVILGGTIIALGSLYALILAWLGEGYGEATVFAVFLVAAMGGALLTGTAAAYLRAIGSPGLEGSYGLVMVALNVLFTVPLAIAFGSVGVVSGTLLAYTLAALWMLRRFAARAPETVRPTGPEMARAALIACPVSLLAGGLGALAATALPQGVALVPVLALTAGALLGFLSLISGRPLTPTGMRVLLADMRGSA